MQNTMSFAKQIMRSHERQSNRLPGCDQCGQSGTRRMEGEDVIQTKSGAGLWKDTVVDNICCQAAAIPVALNLYQQLVG